MPFYTAKQLKTHCMECGKKKPGMIPLEFVDINGKLKHRRWICKECMAILEKRKAIYAAYLSGTLKPIKKQTKRRK